MLKAFKWPQVDLAEQAFKNSIEDAPNPPGVAGFEPSPHLVPDTLYQAFLFYMYQMRGKIENLSISEIEPTLSKPVLDNYAAMVAAYLYLKGKKSYLDQVRNILARHKVELAKFKQLDAECFPIKRPRPSKAK